LSGRLLDTNVLIDLVFARVPQIDLRFSSACAAGEPIFLSAISLYEFRFGAERSKRREFQLAALDRFLASVTVASFDDRDAERAALLTKTLAGRGNLIGSYGLLIAGQALARGWTVVTGNTREFTRVEGLAIENWNLAPP
jgi:tRNA(fMet)-specific endonuclease VapC